MAFFCDTNEVWDMSTGANVSTFTEHLASVWCLDWDGGFNCVSGSEDRLVKLWDLKSGKCIHSYSGHTKGIGSITFDSRYVASGSRDKVNTGPPGMAGGREKKANTVAVSLQRRHDCGIKGCGSVFTHTGATPTRFAVSGLINEFLYRGPGTIPSRSHSCSALVLCFPRFLTSSWISL